MFAILRHQWLFHLSCNNLFVIIIMILIIIMIIIIIKKLLRCDC
jgi:hypothetical protein